MLGLKSWIVLPGPQEETTPSFQHFDADSLSIVEDGGLRARIIAGSGFASAPVRMLSDWSYVAVVLDAGAVAPLDADHEERAIYIVDGEIDIAGDRSEGPRLLISTPATGSRSRPCAAPARCSSAAPAWRDRANIWWNFVSSSRERIEQAKEDWKGGRFEPVPDETEFIPLPDR